MITEKDLKINGSIDAVDRIMKAYRKYQITEAQAFDYLDKNLKILNYV